MRAFLFSLTLLFCASYAQAQQIDCGDLDGQYEEETGFFNMQIHRGVIQSQGRVRYNNQDFYFRHTDRLRWNRELRACSADAYFQVGYRGPFGRIYYCNYPVTSYVRQRTQSNEYIHGQISPTEIQPGPGCYQLGKTERDWVMIREK